MAGGLADGFIFILFSVLLKIRKKVIEWANLKYVTTCKGGGCVANGLNVQSDEVFHATRANRSRYRQV